MTPAQLREARQIGVRLTLLMVCAHWGVSLGALRGQSRNKHAARARRDAYVALRRLGMSLPAIGAALGGRDHTTVLGGIRKHAKEMAEHARGPGGVQ